MITMIYVAVALILYVPGGFLMRLMKKRSPVDPKKDEEKTILTTMIGQVLLGVVYLFITPILSLSIYYLLSMKKELRLDAISHAIEMADTPHKEAGAKALADFFKIEVE